MRALWLLLLLDPLLCSNTRCLKLPVASPLSGTRPPVLSISCRTWASLTMLAPLIFVGSVGNMYCSERLGMGLR